MEKETQRFKQLFVPLNGLNGTNEKNTNRLYAFLSSVIMDILLDCELIATNFSNTYSNIFFEI
jgi:hypothetical protein